MSEVKRGNRFIDLTGRRFRRLAVVSFSHMSKAAYWNVRCDCGTEKTVRGQDLRDQTTLSCGCLQKEQSAQRLKTHGQAGRPGNGVKPATDYSCWQNIHQRCENSACHAFANYGGRGIRVSERWRTFEGFMADILAGLGPRPRRMTLDRIDTNGNYEPGNVRWATPSQQARNRRDTRTVTFHGRRMPVAEAAELTGLPLGRIARRIAMGWSDAEACSMEGRTK